MSDENKDTDKAKKKAPFLRETNVNPRAAGNPLLWGLLICIPLGFGLLLALGDKGENAKPSPREVVEQQRRAESQAQGQQMGGRGGRAVTAPQEQATPSSAPEYACDFDVWVGESAVNEITRAISDAGRAYRVLRPSAVYTQDYRAERINLELNDAGIVSRVWCG